MEFDRVFVSNYLSRERYPHGLLVAIGSIALSLVVSLFYWDNSLSISSQLAATGKSVYQHGEYWRLFSALFAHSSMDHLLSNSLMLFILTYFVTSYYGVWVSPVLSLVMGAVTNIGVLHFLDPEVSLVGASGVVYYLWGFWLFLFLAIEKQVSLIRRLVKVTGIFLILLVPTTYSPSTSYLAHYLGFLLGLITAAIYYPFHAGKFNLYVRYRLVPVPELEEYPSDAI